MVAKNFEGHSGDGLVGEDEAEDGYAVWIPVIERVPEQEHLPSLHDYSPLEARWNYDRLVA